MGVISCSINVDLKLECCFSLCCCSIWFLFPTCGEDCSCVSLPLNKEAFIRLNSELVWDYFITFICIWHPTTMSTGTSSKDSQPKVSYLCPTVLVSTTKCFLFLPKPYCSGVTPFNRPISQCLTISQTHAHIPHLLLSPP